MSINDRIKLELQKRGIPEGELNSAVFAILDMALNDMGRDLHALRVENAALKEQLKAEEMNRIIQEAKAKRKEPPHA